MGRVNLAERRAYDRERYAANPTRQVAYSKKRSAVGRAFIDSLKVSGCVDCGNKNLTVLDLDHVGLKTRDVSAMSTRSFELIEAEAKQCEVRCANCHRIRTRENGYRYYGPNTDAYSSGLKTT